MGGIASRVKKTQISHYFGGGGTKRKFTDLEDYDNNMYREIHSVLHTAKRKKLNSTVEYIYQTLFVEGRDSDVTVVVLGKSYALHRIYLSQSAYFHSMFGGDWRESKQDTVHIDIIDPQITIEAFQTVLGSLYCDEVRLEPLGVVGVLAAATMLQLKGLLTRCSEVMLETINALTVLPYYQAAANYGVQPVHDKCMDWLLVNLVTYYSEHVDQLAQLPLPLLERLVIHPDLVVVKTEISLYALLKYWLYLQLNPTSCSNSNTELDNNNRQQQVDSYFHESKEPVAFLDSDLGEIYNSVFSGVRLSHLVSHDSDVNTLLHDRIIRKDHITSAVMTGWKATLRVNQNEEKGPLDCSDNIFLSHGLRCGRVLTSGGRHMWRWSGFHYGLDLVMTVDSDSVSVKRHHAAQYEQLLSLQTVRHLVVRANCYRLNGQRQVTARYSSGIRRLSLGRTAGGSGAGGDDVVLVKWNDGGQYSNITAEFPLVVAVSLLLVTPEVGSEGVEKGEGECEKGEIAAANEIC